MDLLMESGLAFLLESGDRFACFVAATGLDHVPGFQRQGIVQRLGQTELQVLLQPPQRLGRPVGDLDGVVEIARAHSQTRSVPALERGQAAAVTHDGAVVNENAVDSLRKPITVEDYLNSRMIAEPVHAFQHAIVDVL